MLGALGIASLVLHLHTGVPGQDVRLASDLFGWRQVPMREEGPGDYSISLERPWLHEIDYKFVVDGQWRADPANPSTKPDGHGGVNSVLAIPEFEEDPWLKLRPGAAPLARAELALVDLEGSPRAVTVLSPADGRASVTVYFQDGGDYLEKAGAAELLANLTASPSTLAVTGVFIPPKDRGREYGLLPAYADFVTQKVVPAVEAAYPATGGNRSRRLLVGPSLGGLISLYTALRHPEVFGNVASQSGSLWYQDGKLVNDLAVPVSDPSKKLKVFMDCGTYETSEMPSFNRSGAQAAREAGHEIAYREYPSTHAWIAWRNRLRELIAYIFNN